MIIIRNHERKRGYFPQGETGESMEDAHGGQNAGGLAEAGGEVSDIMEGTQSCLDLPQHVAIEPGDNVRSSDSGTLEEVIEGGLPDTRIQSTTELAARLTPIPSSSLIVGCSYRKATSSFLNGGQKGRPQETGRYSQGHKERGVWESNLVKLLMKSWAHLKVTHGSIWF